MGCYLRFTLTNFMGQVPMALNISRGLGIVRNMVNMQVMPNSRVIQRLPTFLWRTNVPGMRIIDISLHHLYLQVLHDAYRSNLKAL